MTAENKMTPKEKARWLVNDQYYQPLTIHLNLSNNSKEMWEYAKRCATICVDEIIEANPVIWTYRVDPGVEDSEVTYTVSSNRPYWQEVKKEIESL